jgi:hypothetical protein
MLFSKSFNHIINHVINHVIKRVINHVINQFFSSPAFAQCSSGQSYCAPGVHLMKFHLGLKVFEQNFYPCIMDTFLSKNNDKFLNFDNYVHI